MLSFKQGNEKYLLSEGEKKDYWEALPTVVMLVVLISLMIFAILTCNPNLGVSQQ